MRAVVLSCALALALVALNGAAAIQLHRSHGGPATPAATTAPTTKPVTGVASAKPATAATGSTAAANTAAAKPAAAKVPAGMNPRRAFTGGVSASLQRIANLRADMAVQAARLSRVAGVAINGGDATDAALDRVMAAAGTAFVEMRSDAFVEDAVEAEAEAEADEDVDADADANADAEADAEAEAEAEAEAVAEYRTAADAEAQFEAESEAAAELESDANDIPAAYDFFAAKPECALPARFQGMCGSCVTYAVTNALAHRLCAQGKLKRHLSVPYVLGCGASAKANAYAPMAMCAYPTDPFDLTPVLQRGVPDDTCLSTRESTFQCGLFPALAPMISSFPGAFVQLADTLPCVSAWRKDAVKNPPAAPEPLSAASACPTNPSCGGGRRYALSNIHSLTAPPTSQAEIDAAVRVIQREILKHGPVPAIITETPEQLYSYSGGVFSYTKPATPAPKPAAGAPDPSALFLTTAHAITIVGWGTLNGAPYWRIENSWSKGWGSQGFFNLARGQNMLGIEGMAFALRTGLSGTPRYSAETKVSKGMFPFLGLLQTTLARKRTFSPKLAQCVRLLHQLRTAIKTSADDTVIAGAQKALTDFASVLSGLKLDGDQRVGMAFTLLAMADADVEDVALLTGAGLAPHAAALKEAGAAASGAALNDAQVAAVRAFIADHRAAVLLFAGESGVPYANTKDALKRLFMVARADAEATPASLRAFINTHWGLLQNLIRYKLNKAAK